MVSAAARIAPLPHVLGGVVFDMDGLMLDTEPISHAAWFAVGERMGLAIDRTLLDRMIGRNARDCEGLLRERFGAEAPLDAMFAAWHEAYDEALARGIERKPGLVELLDWLERFGIPRAVATSTRRERALRKLGSVDLLDRFAGVVAGDEVARGKPAPDPFLAAAALMGVDAAACVVLEDSEPGVQGALAAGMTPVLVPDLLPPSTALLARGVRVAASLHVVREWLATIVRGDAASAPGDRGPAGRVR